MSPAPSGASWSPAPEVETRAMTCVPSLPVLKMAVGTVLKISPGAASFPAPKPTAWYPAAPKVATNSMVVPGV